MHKNGGAAYEFYKYFLGNSGKSVEKMMRESFSLE